MSPKISLLQAGLTALGCLGLAATLAADPGAPAPPGRSASPAPYTVLLLNDGRVLEGKLSEDPAGYQVHIGGNIIPVRKRAVEGAFRSLREAYQFQAERLPERDPDEQLKLARWCLTNHFNAEARTHLQAVLALSPKHGPALAMLDSLVRNEERAALRDSAVARTSLEAADDSPRELDPRDLRKAQRLPGLAHVNPGLPRIFDLPPPAAVKRANEFARYVQPVLQVACARCHNEQYPGDFQLIEVKTRHDRTRDVYRANLDATLRLVDPDNPGRSELLASALRNHGNGKLKRPIFTGANDPYYQVLATWVNSLRSPRAKGPVLQAGHTAPAGAEPNEEVFAVDRNGRGAMVSATAPRPLPPAALSDGRFPVPFMLGGPKPKLNLPTPPAAKSSIPLPVRPAPAPARPELPTLPPETDDDDDDVPPPPSKSSGKSAAKPVKIDPALLQRALMNRNGPH